MAKEVKAKLKLQIPGGGKNFNYTVAILTI